MGMHTFDLTGNIDINFGLTETNGKIGKFVLDDEVFKSISSGIEMYGKCNVFFIDKYVDIIKVIYDNPFDSAWFGNQVKHECILLLKGA